MLTIEEAKAIMKAGLGKAELEFVASLTAPLYWVIREKHGKFRVRNGSAFFLDAGEGVFGVTAAHVIAGWRTACAVGSVVASQLGHGLTFGPSGGHEIIDIHEKIDVATFRITPAEVAGIGKTVLTGHQKTWPPAPPQQDKGIYYCGFPGRETIWVSPREISLGLAPGSGVASSISDTDISTLIERDHLIDVMGLGLPPENFDFGGMSGGPMLAVVEHNGLRSWRLAGVIYQGPNPSEDEDEAEAIAGLEIIKARRADFIMPNGMLNVSRWDAVNIGK